MLFIAVNPEIAALLILFIIYVYICSYVTRVMPQNVQLWVGLILTPATIAGICGTIFLLTRKITTEGEVYVYAGFYLCLIVFLVLVLPPTLMVWSMWLRNRSLRDLKTSKQFGIAGAGERPGNPEIRITDEVRYDRKQEDRI